MVDIDHTSTNKREILQKLEEKAAKAQEAFEREEKAKKELEVLYAKILAEKTELLNQLDSEKGSMGDIQERANKLQAQKSDMESQLAVSLPFYFFLDQKSSFSGIEIIEFCVNSFYKF